MKLAHFLAFAAVMYGLFGLGLLAAPASFMAPYELTFDLAGAHIARVLGAALLGFAITFWLARGWEAAALRPLLIGSLAYNLADLPINVMAIQGGLMNALGWIPIALHLVLAAGFAWFSLQRNAK